MEASPDLTRTQRQADNRRLALKLAAVALAFVGFGFAMAPLYDTFCRITGLNGRTGEIGAQLAQNTQVDRSRWVTVEFLSHVMPGDGLKLVPEQFKMKVHPGEIVLTKYIVTNETGGVYSGQAVPSVTPLTTAKYFKKIECFCFSPQTFQPGETRELPVTFVVSPELSEDLRTVTLSYTFYRDAKAVASGSQARKIQEEERGS
ncbi:MAG: cytochrome c oxidase assembly protein [Thiobacillus sp.]